MGRVRGNCVVLYMADTKDGQRMKITIEPLELSSDPEGSR